MFRCTSLLCALLCLLLALAAGCSGNAAPPSNLLEMKLDGKPWRADRALFGAVDPPGYAHAVLIAGSLGPKDASEQTFNLNIADADKPGRYHVRSSQASVGNAAQIGNLSRERYLAGGALGFDVTVDITVAQKNPARIEARFSGTLTANDGAQVVVTDGHFRYAE